MHSVDDASSGLVFMTAIEDLRYTSQLLLSASEMDRKEINWRIVERERRRRLARGSASFDLRKIVIVVLVASSNVGYVVLSARSNVDYVALTADFAGYVALKNNFRGYVVDTRFLGGHRERIKYRKDVV
jgi:hypothetical protein